MAENFTPIEIHVLCYLLSGEHRPSEIIRILGISKASFTKSSGNLIKGELISKRLVADGTYPPPVYYSITEKGKKALREVLKVDEFLKKFEKEEITALHILVLNHLAELVIYGRGEVTRENLEYEAIAYLAGWIEFHPDGSITITKEGWRAIFRFLPTRQFQTIQLLAYGKGQVDIDDVTFGYLASLRAAVNKTGKFVDSVIPVDKQKDFKEMVKEREQKLEKAIKEKLRRD